MTLRTPMTITNIKYGWLDRWEDFYARYWRYLDYATIACIFCLGAYAFVWGVEQGMYETIPGMS